MTDLVFSEASEAIHRIEMRRPDKRNALTEAMYRALAGAIERAEADASVRVILIEGSGGHFSAGNDLADFLENPPASEEAPVFEFLRWLIRAEKPIVAGVNGNAVGIGTTMLLHCDYVVAGEGARLLLPFVDLGLCPEAASSLLLPLAIGPKHAGEMLLFGDRIDAAKALEWGLVNQVVAPEAVHEMALSRARALAAKPAAALRASKALIRRPLRSAALNAVSEEAKQFGALLQTPAARECLAAFLEKRKADPAKLV